MDVPTLRHNIKIVKLKIAVTSCFLPTEILKPETIKKKSAPITNLTQVIIMGETSAETILVKGYVNPHTMARGPNHLKPLREALDTEILHVCLSLNS